MTLIEIMIVVVIIGGMMALGASFLFPGNEAKMRDESGRLAGVIKYVYNESAIRNRYYRLVFDFEGNSYSVESSGDPFRITVETEDSLKTSFASNKSPESNPEASPSGANFTPEDEQYLVRPHSLPTGVKFKDVFVMHEKDRQGQGKVYAYFFPNGWAERMVINLTDEEEESFYSLEVNPLTGKSKIRSEYFEIKAEDLKAGTGAP